MKTRLHLAAGGLAGLLIAAFMLSTLVVELLGSPAAVASVKHLIVVPGLFILIPALVATGVWGFVLRRGRRGALVDAKTHRMPVIALNGLLVLVPCALFLDSRAAAGSFDGLFYAVQAIELIAGATNLSLMALNLRDGLRLTGRLALPRAGVHHAR